MLENERAYNGGAPIRQATAPAKPAIPAFLIAAASAGIAASAREARAPLAAAMRECTAALRELGTVALFLDATISRGDFYARLAESDGALVFSRR